MPTVQIQQLYCASPRHHDERYVKKSCRCLNVPTLTARVSRLTIHDGSVAFSSKGFSTIIPSRGCPHTIKSTEGSSLSSLASSSTSGSSSILKNLAPDSSNKCQVTPTRRFVSPSRTSYRSKSAGRQPKCPPQGNNPIINRKSCESLISKRFENISISERKVVYNNLSVKKDESQNQSGVTNTSYQKYNKFAQSEKNVNVEIKSENKNAVSKLKASSCSDLQLLHPGWRKIPWKPHFGWTDSHQELCKRLRQEVKSGSVESIYYSSEEAHEAAGAAWRSLGHPTPFLAGPSVSSVAEVLEVIKRMSAERAPWLYTGRARWHRRPANACELLDYDADDED